MIYLLNAIAALLFLYVMYRLLKAIYLAYKSPKKILSEAIEDEKKRKERLNSNIISLREVSQGKMLPVVKAVEEMNEALPSGQRFRFTFENAKLYLEIDSTEYEIFFHMDEVDLDAAGNELRTASSENDKYVVEPSDGPRLELTGKDNVVRYLAREIAKYVESVRKQ